MMARTDAERDLLIALLAHSRGRLDRTAMLGGLESWTAAGRRQSLVELLVERGSLKSEDLPELEAEIDREPSNDEDLDRVFEGLDLSNGASLDAAVASFGRHGATQTSADPSAVTQVHRSGSDQWTEAGRILASTFEIRDPVEQSAEGRFQIVKLLARGGLGEVHIARDVEVGRTVALKVMRPEILRHDSLRARFLRESEINGNLEHPGIIPVYGKGTFPDGRPYYAMRLVDGGTLQQAIKRFHAEVAESPRAVDWSIRIRPLLRRFLVVCEAIAYAHGRGVLHRDLKPSNILLGPYGETLIIDWGLAKLKQTGEGSQADTLITDSTIEPSVTASQLVLHSSSGSQVPTLAGETLGSPQYMSPEQARGEQDKVGEASDIYSLGATLYTLLTDQPPVSGLPLQETLRRVGKGQFAPVETVNPRVPAALGSLCQRAMRLEPTERYSSARALADDLERWLADEPVTSYQEPWTTHLARWARRHKPLVAAALGLLVAGLIGLAVNNILVEGQKQIALKAQLKAERAEADTAKALGVALEAKQRARDHLAIGTELISQFIALGDRQLAARLPANARRPFLEQATEYNRRFREREPDNLPLRESAADADRRLANLSRLMGEPERARDLLLGAIDAFKTLPESPTRLDMRAQSLIDLGDTYSLLGEFSAAEAAYKSARVDALRLVETAGGDPNARRTLARALDRLGSVAHLRGNLGDAEAFLREAVATLVPLAADTPQEVHAAFEENDSRPLTDQLDLTGARVRLAEVLAELAQPEHSKEQLALASERMDRLHSAFGDPPSRDVEFFHAWVAIHEIRARLDRGETASAAATLEEILAELEGLEAEDPGQPHIERARAEAHLECARAARADGQFAESESQARLGLERLHEPGQSATDPERALLQGALRKESGEAILAGGAADRRIEALAHFQAADRDFASVASAGLRPPRLTRMTESVRARIATLGVASGPR